MLKQVKAVPTDDLPLAIRVDFPDWLTERLVERMPEEKFSPWRAACSIPPRLICVSTPCAQP